MKLHTLALATHSYVLLTCTIGKLENRTVSKVSNWRSEDPGASHDWISMFLFPASLEAAHKLPDLSPVGLWSLIRMIMYENAKHVRSNSMEEEIKSSESKHSNTAVPQNLLDQSKLLNRGRQLNSNWFSLSLESGVIEEAMLLCWLFGPLCNATCVFRSFLQSKWVSDVISCCDQSCSLGWHSTNRSTFICQSGYLVMWSHTHLTLH